MKKYRKKILVLLFMLTTIISINNKIDPDDIVDIHYIKAIDS